MFLTLPILNARLERVGEKRIRSQDIKEYREWACEEGNKSVIFTYGSSNKYYVVDLPVSVLDEEIGEGFVQMPVIKYNRREEEYQNKGRIRLRPEDVKDYREYKNDQNHDLSVLFFTQQRRPRLIVEEAVERLDQIFQPKKLV